MFLCANALLFSLFNSFLLSTIPKISSNLSISPFSSLSLAQGVHSVLCTNYLCGAVKVVGLPKDYVSRNIIIFLDTCVENSKIF
jgi:hypothetical protein